MKTLIALLTLAVAGSTFAQMTQVELGRQYDRDQRMDAIYNEAGRSRYESLSYPTYQRR